MSLRINTNVTALNALRNLDQTSSTVSKSIERLSSGLRINNASDDPAGLIISEGLRSQIDGLNQAISNSQDANNLIKTAEGGLTEVNSLLRSIRTLAVHAANTGANDANAAQADQQQIQSAIDTIDRIATQTQFGTKKLLDGTAGVTAAVVDTQNVSGIAIGGNFNSLQTQNGTVSIQVTTAATRAASTGAATYASVNTSLSLVNGGTQGAGGTVVINGQSLSVSGADTVQSLINKINNLAGSTGVSANFTSANGSGSIVLTQQNYGANFKINESESATLINGTSGINTTGVNAVATVTAYASTNGGAAAAQTATFTGGRSSTDSGLRLTDTSGNSILLTEAGNGTTGTIAVGQITAGNVQFQIGANANQTVSTSLGNIQTNQLGNTSVNGLTLRTLDVTTASGAANALTSVDEAIQQVSKLRASLGSFQKNTLDSTTRALGVGVENLSASESQIRDTNVADEVVKLTKNQILQQAGTSVLAQANQAPQSVLSLLR
jgi:flagellin